MRILLVYLQETEAKQILILPPFWKKVTDEKSYVWENNDWYQYFDFHLIETILITGIQKPIRFPGLHQLIVCIIARH